MVKKRKKRRGHYLRGTVESIKGGACKYRSGWELAYIQHLDSDVNVASFQYEGVIIPYVSNVRSGKLRKYFPDFFVTYVDGHTELVEIKPRKRLVQANVTKKLKAASTWCLERGVTLVVVTEVELKAMGLLK